MFEYGGEQPVKNIAKPIPVWHWKSDATTQSTQAPAVSEKPSIAVLPFENMSGDPEQAYFSDGITEDIITELSRFRSLHVIARNSSFQFRGGNVDIAEVGRRLGVQYVVEGSVRKAGDRIRVTAQLIEASGTHHLWAEKYDRKLEDVFAVQDELTRGIVLVLVGRLENAGRDRALLKPTTNMTAYECVLLGNERLKLLGSPEHIAEARSWYQKAIDLDPRYAHAHAGIAWTHVSDATQAGSWNDAAVRLCLQCSETALGLDDTDSWIHCVYGQALVLAGKDNEAESHFRQGIELNPNDAEGVAMYTPALIYFGRWQEALEMVKTAERLNPFGGQRHQWYRGFATFSARDYVSAVEALEKLDPVPLRAQAFLAASYGHLGRIDEARRQLSKLSDAHIDQSRKKGEEAPQPISTVVTEWADRYRNPTDRENLLDGLRKAGLPE